MSILKFKNLGFQEVEGFNEANEIYVYFLTRIQLDESTQNNVNDQTQLTRDEKQLYGDIVEGFTVSLDGNDEFNAEKLKMFIESNSAKIKQLLKKLTNVVSFEDEIVSVSDVSTVLKFYTTFIQDYPMVKENLVQSFTDDEKKLLENTVVIVNRIMMGFWDLKGVTTLVEFLKEHKHEIKYLAKKIKTIEENTNSVYRE